MGTLRIIFGVSAAFAAGAIAFGLAGSLRAEPASGPHIPSVTIDGLLESMRAGRRVVFVDVRERGEYVESHIPGAVHLPGREITEEGISILGGADLVVPYCLKDFRGFEGAKRLRRLGVENVHLIEGFGIAAWRAAGLPVAGRENARTDAEVLRELLGPGRATSRGEEGGR